MSERRVLQVSVIIALFFALFGIIYGIIIESSMVMFDGIYSTISVLLSLLSLLVLKQVESATETENFPFGKWHFEPALVVFKSLVIVSLCIYSLSNAVADLLSGGNEVDISDALIYAVISFSICAIVYLFIKRRNNKLNSELLKAEATQWLGDTLLSLGVMIGFGAALLLIGSNYEHFVPYTDPAMVIIASLIFLIFPFQSLFQSIKQLIFYKGDNDQRSKIESLITQMATSLDAKHKIHFVQIGRELFLEVNFLLENREFSVHEMDAIRNKIENSLEQQVWLNINFTTEKKWL